MPLKKLDFVTVILLVVLLFLLILFVRISGDMMNYNIITQPATELPVVLGFGNMFYQSILATGIIGPLAAIALGGIWYKKNAM
jgi:hypothetical protein